MGLGDREEWGMKVTVTVVLVVLLVCVMAWGAVACSSDKGAATQPASHPGTTVMGLQTEPTWSPQIIIDGDVPVLTERAPSRQVIE